MFGIEFKIPNIIEALMRRQKSLDVFLEFSSYAFWLLIILLCVILLTIFRKKKKLLYCVYILLFSTLFAFAIGNPPQDGCIEGSLVPPLNLHNQHKELRIMSFNIRGATMTDGSEDDWNRGRKSRSVELLREVNPDVVGIQEGEPTSLQEYVQNGYQYYCKRGEEQSAILYNPNRVELIESGHFYLSSTPHSKSLTPNSRFFRVCHWGHFRLKNHNEKLPNNSDNNETEKHEEQRNSTSFYLFNVHLDPFSEEVRRMQAKYLLDYINNFDSYQNQLHKTKGRDASTQHDKKPFDKPILITGDFNSITKGSVYSEFIPSQKSSISSLLLSSSLNSSQQSIDDDHSKDHQIPEWLDVWETAESRCSSTISTFHGFSGMELSSLMHRISFGVISSLISRFMSETPLAWMPLNFHIDWILQYNNVMNRDNMLHCSWMGVIRKEHSDHRFASDHYPLLAFFDI
jgi:endonuclease/exonuclease/phosphatase family metal-dependent hydrolase